MKLTNREKVKLLLETATTVEQANEVIEENFAFESLQEKVAFLKGMFDIEVIGHEEAEPDEMTYFAMLKTIICI